MHNFFYISDIFLWIIISIFFVGFLIFYIIDISINHISPLISNLIYFVFGPRKQKGKCLSAWETWYRNRPGIRNHWKSMKHFRRLAYIRFLKEVRKEIYQKYNL